MGNCTCNPKDSMKSPKVPEPIFPRTINARIKSKQEGGKGKEGKNRMESVSFKVSEPLILISNSIRTATNNFNVSGCVLPNQDPRAQLHKSCQDICFVEEGQFTILLGCYDGHGETGTQVVEFCRDFVRNYYQNNEQIIADTSDGPQLFLTSVCHDCHKAVCDSKIDVTFSGSTQVLILVYNNIIYHANLGDSRAVLASIQDISYVPKPVEKQKAANFNPKAQQDLKSGIRFRKTQLVPGLNAVQLTRDQKPEDSEELPRLIASGARLERMSDNGKKYGPLRVWKQNANTPGLAMARSLGDTVGKEIGVICTPAISTHPIDADKDFFIVMGSDGIWDVMDSSEVISFVATYRTKCAKNMTRQPNESVRPQNTIIAHLLCEEARMRWVQLIENEDVVIDDISCVILDFNTYKQIDTNTKRATISPESPSKPTIKATPSPTHKQVASPTSAKRRGIILPIKIEKSI